MVISTSNGIASKWKEEKATKNVINIRAHFISFHWNLFNEFSFDCLNLIKLRIELCSIPIQRSISSQWTTVSYYGHYDWVDGLKNVAKQLCSNDRIYGVHKLAWDCRTLDK